MWPVFPFILRPGPHPHSPPPEDNNDHGGIRSANFASCLVGGHCGHSAKSSAGKMRQKQRQFEHLGLFVNGRGRKTRPDQLIGKWIEYTQFLSLTRFTSFAVDGGHGTLLTVSYANDRRLNSCKWICNSFLLVSFTRSLFFPSFFLSLMIYVHVCLSVCPPSGRWVLLRWERRPLLKKYRLIRRLIPPLVEEAQDFVMNRYVTFIQIPVFEHQSSWMVCVILGHRFITR